MSYGATQVRWVDGVARSTFAGSATVNVEVLDRTSTYTDRLLQADLRVTKVFNMGPSRMRAMFDLYNMFNDNTVLKFNETYGSPTRGGADWLNPQALIPGRMLKFGAQLDF